MTTCCYEARSLPSLYGGTSSLALTGRANMVKREADQDPSFAFHGLAVLVPVRMLASRAAIVVHKEIHSFRQDNDFRLAIDLDPGAEKPIHKDA